MIKIEKIMVPAYEKDEITYSCDLCGVDLERQDGSGEPFGRSRAYLEYMIGNSYPEVDAREGMIIDICAKCQRDTVFPLIVKELKIKPRKAEGYLK